MAGWVADRLPEPHALRPALEPFRLGLLARQMLLRRNMRTLLAACDQVGVESVLLKGFMLAEFAYRVPGLRPYGDIDLLIRPEQLGLLTGVAQRLGWREDGLAGRSAEWTHEIAHFYSPDGQVRLDVHRYVTGWQTGPSGQARRLTRALWEASEPVLLDGVSARRPAWNDCALQLVLGRSWTEDDGRYKPADYTDLEALAGCPGVTPTGLSRRAAQLGAAHTWRAFLAGCDPWRGHFEYQSGIRARLIRRAALLDGAALPTVSRLRRARRLPRLLWRMGLALPDVLAVRRSLKAGAADPRQLVRQMKGADVSRSSLPLRSAQIEAITAGVRWLTRLFYPRSPGICVPRSLATYRALHRRGFPAVYVSGVRRSEEGSVEGHAWVEGPDGPLEAYGETTNRFLFQVLFEERPPGR